MIAITPYLQLLRLHKPIGTLLLWFPTAWALWLAGHPTPRLVFYFFLGTFIMRSAGCLVNDIADRHIDPHVARTKHRPLAAQTVSLQAATGLLIMLLMLAFIILVQLPKACFNYALISVLLTVVYPFCKRFLEAPQLVLGLAFSMGIPMAYAAEGVPFDTSTGILMLLNFFWIMAYDTIYALADQKDDMQIGVKSTAILFGKHAKNIIAIFQTITQTLWLVIASRHGFDAAFYIAWSLGWVLFGYQQWMIRKKNPHYLKTFSSNGVYGLVFWFWCIWRFCSLII